MTLSNTGPKTTLSPHLGIGDIKLLRVFRAVADAGSYAGAQSLLNVSASSISSQMSTLESRLGMRLCSRGRSGFRLTEAGGRVLEASHRLFAAHEDFDGEIWSTRERQLKVLRVGIVDSVISNNDFLLPASLRRLWELEGPIEIHISTLSPSEIEQAVLRSELDIGIGVFFHKIPGLHYDTFLTTEQVLCCGHNHACFERAPDDVTIEEVTTLPYVARTYLGERSVIPGIPFKLMAYAQSIEATAVLVLTGQYVGHLPSYYAESWIAAGQMRCIRHDQLSYKNRFGFAIRETIRPDRLVLSLTELLLELHQTPVKGAP